MSAEAEIHAPEQVVELAVSPGAEARRARILAGIPSWYSPWAHLGATTLLCLGAIVGAALGLRAVSWLEWLTVPAVLVLANGLEWRAHRNVLHRRQWYAPVLYDRHTPMHHVVYTYDDMAVRAPREMGLVLIPPYGVAAVILTSAPFALGAGRLLGANVGWLVLLCSAAYVLLYEWTHMAYHLPEQSAVGRSKLIRSLREHHRRHHHPRLMQRWNFNVTLPLFDWVHRTVASDELVARVARGERP